MMTVGVLALQGNVIEHCSLLQAMDVSCIEVRTIEDLHSVDALILPGGESSVMMKLMQYEDLHSVIVRRVQEGMPVLGTCAGAILLSDSHLGVMDITVLRNAYGSQMQSFDAEVSVEGGGLLKVAFVRAPKITRVGSLVSVLAVHNGDPVLVQQGTILAMTCHPEVRNEKGVHQLLLSLVKSSNTSASED